MSRFVRSVAAAMLATLSIAPALAAQSGTQSGTQRDRESGAPVRRVISIGHHPRVDGIRINFRDRELDLVRGANITVWSPRDGSVGGEVRGLALGLPITSAGEISGLGLGLFGVGAEHDFTGIGFGGIGLGAGRSLRGIAIGGVGVGAGGDVRGLSAGGIGIGAGGDIRGMAIGGVGAAAGGSVRGMLVGGIGAAAGGDSRGLVFGGIGAGVGGNARGITIGGIGVGAGGSIRGLTVGGIGVGAGGNITGITVGGVGVGSGGTLRGLSLGGLGVGAPRIEGIAVGGMVGAERTKAVVIAPALFRTAPGGQMTGVAISSVNYIRGSQRGLTLGLVNYTERLHGIQVGALNIVADRPWPFKALPILNVGRDR